MRCSTCQQRPLMMSVHLAEHRSPWPANLNWGVQRRERRAVEWEDRRITLRCSYLAAGCCAGDTQGCSGFNSYLPLRLFIHSFVQVKQSAFWGRSHSLISASSAVLKWYFCSIKHPVALSSAWPSLPALQCLATLCPVSFQKFLHFSCSTAVTFCGWLFWGVGGDNLCWFLFLLPD